MELLRLQRTDPRAWHYYPEFEERVLALQRDLNVRGLPSMLRETLARRWIDFPQMAAYYLALEGDQPFAHAASWVETQWGIPYVLIYSCQADQHFSLRGVLDAYFQSLLEFINHFNASLPADKQKITEIDLWTPWEPVLWERLLHMTDVKAHYHVLRMTAGGLQPRVERPLGELLS